MIAAAGQSKVEMYGLCKVEMSAFLGTGGTIAAGKARSRCGLSCRSRVIGMVDFRKSGRSDGTPIELFLRFCSGIEDFGQIDRYRGIAQRTSCFGIAANMLSDRQYCLLPVGLGDLAHELGPGHVHGPVDVPGLWPRVVP
jgi:hypothetical protein